MQCTVHVHRFVVPRHARRHDEGLEVGALRRGPGVEHIRLDRRFLLGDLGGELRLPLVKLGKNGLHALGRLGVELMQDRGDFGGRQPGLFDAQGGEGVSQGGDT
jgi:hypothetical protein